MTDRVLAMIGMAKRAGKVHTGEFVSGRDIKSGAAHLVIIARDASDNTKKAVADSCRYYNVEYVEYGTRDELGQCTGGGYKAVVSVVDKNFSKAILDKMRLS